MSTVMNNRHFPLVTVYPYDELSNNEYDIRRTVVDSPRKETVRKLAYKRVAFAVSSKENAPLYQEASGDLEHWSV